MKINRVWALVMGSVVAAFLFVACSGGSDSVASPTPVSRNTDTPGPVATGTARVPTPQPPQDSAEPVAGAPEYVWEISTVDANGAKPSLAVEPSGVPHIAYLLEDMPGFVKHAVLGAEGWDISTVATGYFYGPLDIQLDSGGSPHIGWHNHDEENAAYAVLSDGTWVVHDIQHPGHDGWDTDIALNSQGLPQVVGVDPIQFGGRSGVELATFDGQSWSVEEIGSGPVPYEFGTSVVVDAQDRPHVVWFDATDKDLKYAGKQGNSWEVSTVDGEGDVGRFASMAIDGEGNPAISYFEATGSSTGYIKFASWDGNEWNTERIDKLDKVFRGHFGARKTSSLVLDRDDNPIIAYSDEEVIKLARWNGSIWSLDTVLIADGDPLGQQVSLGLDNNGVLHLTFADVARKGGSGVKGTIKYARGTPLTAAPAPIPVASKEPIPSPQPIATDASLVQPDPNYEEELARAQISTRGWKTDFSLHTVPFGEIFSGGVPRDGIPPLDNPKFVTPDQANEWLGDLEPVISIEINGDAKAYPLQILTWHEIVNDVVGGLPVIVSFCPLCNSAVSFDRTLDGVVHDFGVSGNLRNSDLIMWDRQTETWWQQITGEAIVGELAGKQLTFLPAPIISWTDFRATHPNGVVLSKETGFKRSYGRNPYAGYDRVDEPPFLYFGDLDGRLLPKERVAAFTIGNVAAAFPFSILAREGVVNYNVNGVDLSVFFKPGTRSALGASFIAEADEIGAIGVFDATLDGRKLTFRTDGESFMDNETGSTWNILGQATAGSLIGSRLTPIVHGNHFWFSWGAFQPDTVIYQGAA